MTIVLRSKLCNILHHTARIGYENTYYSGANNKETKHRQPPPTVYMLSKTPARDGKLAAADAGVPGAVPGKRCAAARARRKLRAAPRPAPPHLLHRGGQRHRMHRTPRPTRRADCSVRPRRGCALPHEESHEHGARRVVRRVCVPGARGREQSLPRSEPCTVKTSPRARCSACARPWSARSAARLRAAPGPSLFSTVQYRGRPQGAPRDHPAKVPGAQRAGRAD